MKYNYIYIYEYESINFDWNQIILHSQKKEEEKKILNNFILGNNYFYNFKKLKTLFQRILFLSSIFDDKYDCPGLIE